MFYEQFAMLCKQHNVKETSLARELGMGASAPGRWKKGSTPDLINAKKIADYFGVTLDYLIDGDTNTSLNFSNSVVMHTNSGNHVSISNGHTTPEHELSEQEEEVLRIFRALDMRQKHTAMNCLYDLEDQAKQKDS